MQGTNYNSNFTKNCILDEPVSSDPLAEFKKERLKYKVMRKQQGMKGTNREEITLSLLDKFKSKLTSARSMVGDYESDEEEKVAVEEEEEETVDSGDLSWYIHVIQ